MDPMRDELDPTTSHLVHWGLMIAGRVDDPTLEEPPPYMTHLSPQAGGQPLWPDEEEGHHRTSRFS